MYTVQEVAEKVDYEGTGYAICHYFGRDLNSEDDELNELWRVAYDAVNAVEDYLPELEY